MGWTSSILRTFQGRTSYCGPHLNLGIKLSSCRRTQIYPNLETWSRVSLRLGKNKEAAAQNCIYVNPAPPSQRPVLCISRQHCCLNICRKNIEILRWQCCLCIGCHCVGKEIEGPLSGVGICSQPAGCVPYLTRL